jgi:hypothetical protein
MPLFKFIVLIQLPLVISRTMLAPAPRLGRRVLHCSDRNAKIQWDCLLEGNAVNAWNLGRARVCRALSAKRLPFLCRFVRFLLLLFLGELGQCFVDVAEHEIVLRAVPRVGSKRQRSRQSDVF